MSTQQPILVTGAAGQVGGIGGAVVRILLERQIPVRAFVRRDDERADALRRAGAEIFVGDLTRTEDVARAVDSCRRIYFGMSVSSTYLEATVSMAAVARDKGDIDVLINMSQMTVSRMNIRKMTDSSQQRQHWLGEQALNWSGLPVVHVRPTVFQEGFFLLFTSDSVRESNQIRLPFGEGKTSPVAADEVGRVIATLLASPQSHIGKTYHLTGPQ